MSVPAIVRLNVDDEMHWDQDVRLIDPDFAIPMFSHHTETGAALLTASFRGAWKRAAIDVLLTSLTALLPSRVDVCRVGRGGLRITSCVGVTESSYYHTQQFRRHGYGVRDSASCPSEMSEFVPTVSRTFSSVLRAYLFQEYGVAAAYASHAAVKPPSAAAIARFHQSLAELGAAEFPPQADRVGARGDEDWFKLRHSWLQEVSNYETWFYGHTWPNSAQTFLEMIDRLESGLLMPG